MEAHEAFERFEKHSGHDGHGGEQDERDLARTAAFMVAVIAAFLAIATFLGNESNKEAIQQRTTQSDAASDIATFETQELIYNSDLVLLGPLSTSQDSGIAKTATDEIKQIAPAQKRIPAEKKKTDEKLKEAKKEVKHANDQHLLYELAAVLLQISIVLASVAIIARRRFLLYGGGGLSVIGVVVLVIGYVS